MGPCNSHAQERSQTKRGKKRKENLKRQFIPAQPSVTGPVLVLENVTLTFLTPSDSAVISKTNGKVMLANNVFVGDGGAFSWQANNMPATADIRKYSFSTATPRFKAPDVTVTYPSVLEAPVEGALEWASGGPKSGKTQYPKFLSFTNDAQMKNLGNNIRYKGGFSMAGSHIDTKALDGSLSEIVVLRGGERKFRTLAHKFDLTDSLIAANSAAVSIYQQQDSLTHPSMQLQYEVGTQDLKLIKNRGPFAEAPFYDTFHQMEISADLLRWNLKEPDVNFSMLNTKNLLPVQLESTAFFSNNRFQQLIGIATFHPLQLLVSYAAKAKSSEFYVPEVARATQVSEKALQEATANLARESYLEYDRRSGYVKLKPKAWHYVMSARNLKDYDHLVIASVSPSGKNVSLNLSDNTMTVRGVERITFTTDSSNVYILPRGQEVQVLKNRDILFNGQLYASQLAFKGREFRFNYDEFSIDLAKLDTVALVSSLRRAQRGEAADQVLTGKGSKMSGKLYINKPNNKSGRLHLLDYPKFDAPFGAMVAFNKPDVAGGAYDSTVYFDMPPFKIDSLSSGKGIIALDGTFNSGGIFPPIKTKLQLMPDQTLGFYYEPPAKGLPAYGGKGMVLDTIMMSSAGIQSKGRITYLAALLEAPAFTYYKNAVVTKEGTKASIAEGAYNGAGFPAVSLVGYRMNWLPQADTMYLQSGQEPMLVFKEKYTFKGVAQLSPGGLYGSGAIESPIASVTAPEFVFQQRTFSAHNATFIAKSEVQSKPSVKAQNMAVVYDLEKATVDFGSEQQHNSSIVFPKAQYKTSMSSAHWDIGRQKVTLAADKDGANWFYSLKPEQDSLRFMAASGEYDLKKNTILAGGVPYIAVADVYVVPDSGKVSIAADATMQALRNAKITADSLRQYHQLYAGTVEVLSRKSFSGTARLDYQNAAADTFQLTFADFLYGEPEPEEEPAKKSKKQASEAQRPLYTLASAQVSDAKPFYILPRILYRGHVTMRAPRQYMDFDGDLKLNFTGNPADSDWFPYKKDSLNPDDIRIPVVAPRAADDTPLHTGLHIAIGSGKLYSTFVSKKQDEDDLDVFLVDGLLSYDRSRGEFKLGQQARAYGDAFQGNMLRYNETTNTINFDGKLNLLKPMKNFKVEAAGSGSANVDSARYSLDALLAFDLDVPSQALSAMAENLRGNAAGANGAFDSDERMLYKLAELIGEKEARQYQSRAMAAYVPLPKVSSKLVRSLLFNQVNLRWSAAHNAWYSIGKISMASILKEDINAQLDGYLELKQDFKGEPVMNLYLQADPYTWYYFSFIENGLTMASSDERFNKTIRSKSRGNRGSTGNYSFYAGETIEKNEFLAYFSDTYLHGKGELKEAPVQPMVSDVGEEYTDEADQPKKEKKRRRKKSKADPFEEGVDIDLNNQ